MQCHYTEYTLIDNTVQITQCFDWGCKSSQVFSSEDYAKLPWIRYVFCTNTSYQINNCRWAGGANKIWQSFKGMYDRTHLTRIYSLLSVNLLCVKYSRSTGRTIPRSHGIFLKRTRTNTCSMTFRTKASLKILIPNQMNQHIGRWRNFICITPTSRTWTHRWTYELSF